MTIHLISYIYSGSSLIHEIIQYFSPVKIYVPWGESVPEFTDNSEIIVSYPPEDFKPEADFNTLLDECFNWAYEQGEKSRKEIIKTGHPNPTSNESLRHIKTILSNRISDTSEKDMILRWHMLLHMANRLEKNRNDANRMLEALKKKPSPLLNNAELTENTRYPLENLRAIESDFFINDTGLKQLLRAWHGLFSSRIDADDMLLAIDRRIFEHLKEKWIIFNDTDLKKPEIVSFRCPLSKKTDIKNAEITICNDIQNIVTSETKQEDKIVALKKLASEFETMFQAETEHDHLLFSLLLFLPAGKPEEYIKDTLLKFLSGRTLIFAEMNV